MSIVHIGSTAEWKSLLSGTTIVVADFYADWCGPCKMIAPTFERLAKEHSRPKRVAFAKIDVDSQTEISQTYSVSAMPTFKIFRNGTCIETIQGANPTALTTAVNKVVLASAGERSDDLFKTRGRRLGDGQGGSMSSGLARSGSSILDTIIRFFGLYLVSLLSVDALTAARESRFNIDSKRPSQQKKKQ